MRALAALVLALTVGGAAVGASVRGAQAQTITAATFAEPTDRYDHAILGDAIEWGALRLRLSDGRAVVIRLPETRVFEDLEPRLADLTGDGAPEVIVVETDLSRGARLSVYGAGGLISATPYIGQTHRWLAPIGAADLDGDGRVEIAYIDRPHLARLARVWRLENGRLRQVAVTSGLTNHRIGEDFISGGIRDCGAGPELVTANSDWSAVMATRLARGALISRPVGTLRGAQDFDRALACGKAAP